MTQLRYTAAGIKAAVDLDKERYFAPWLVGRSATYVADSNTVYTVATGYFLEEELQRLGVNDADRITQAWKYNRFSRTYDIFETAAECLNDVLDGTVEKNRIGHRRWG